MQIRLKERALLKLVYSFKDQVVLEPDLLFSVDCISAAMH